LNQDKHQNKRTEKIVEDALSSKDKSPEKERWLAQMHECPVDKLSYQQNSYIKERSLLTLDASSHSQPLPGKCES
jgi:hypothetical protein